MRKIRFRGWNPEIKDWVYGDLFHCKLCLESNGGKEETVTAILDDSGTALAVEPESVGQFTGFQDYYKEDIYEGDILTNGDHDEQWTVRMDDEGHWNGEGDWVVEELFSILVNEPWPEVVGNEWEMRKEEK